LACVLRFPLDPILATLGEPLATAVYSFALVKRVVSPRRMAIIGAGPVGVLNAIFVARRGVEVTIFERWAERRNVVSALLPEVEARVFDPSDVRSFSTPLGTGFDAVILAASRDGALAGIRLAAQIVREDGCINLVTGFPDDLRIEELGGFAPNSVR